MNKPKVDGEMVKRLFVGVACMAWYLIPMYVHPFLNGPISFLTAGCIHMETFNVYLKDFEKSSNNLFFRFCLFFFLYLYFVPKFGFLERNIMERSGYTAAEYPLLFTVLYERNAEICLSAFCLLFVWIVC